MAWSAEHVPPPSIDADELAEPEEEDQSPGVMFRVEAAFKDDLSIKTTKQEEYVPPRTTASSTSNGGGRHCYPKVYVYVRKDYQRAAGNWRAIVHQYSPYKTESCSRSFAVAKYGERRAKRLAEDFAKRYKQYY